MKQDLELKLQAWLDGELSPAEAEAMRRFTESDPAAQSLVAELQGIRAALSQHEQSIAVPETREFYWSKIQREIQRAEQQPRPKLPWTRRWRLWIAPVAGASALAAVLLITLHPASEPVAFNEVTVTAAGYQARTSHDKATGVNFVLLQGTTPPEASSDGRLQPARARGNGSSFMIDME
jgi:anti-sigma factor RsiW